MKELKETELAIVNGGGDVEWGVSVATSVSFLAMALAVTNPVGVGVLAGASIISSGLAIYHKLN